MRIYALMLPILLLVTIGSLIPNNYVLSGNVTQTYRSYNPKMAVGLKTAYEYTINNSVNRPIVFTIANYSDYASALNAYNLLYSSELNRMAAIRISNSTLEQAYNLSQIKSLEKYSEFTESNALISENYTRMFLLVGNSVMQIDYVGNESITTTLPIGGLNLLPVITTTNTQPVIPIVINYSTFYLIIGSLFGIVVVMIVASIVLRRRSKTV